jgi:hypothetical protein
VTLASLVDDHLNNSNEVVIVEFAGRCFLCLVEWIALAIKVLIFVAEAKYPLIIIEYKASELTTDDDVFAT